MGLYLKSINLKLTLITCSITWAIFTIHKLTGADSGEPRPGSNAYYFKKGCDDYSGTPSLANLIEQTAALQKDLGAGGGMLGPRPESAERIFITHKVLVQIVEYTQADGQKLNCLAAHPDLFSTYCAKPQTERSGEKDFSPDTKLVNPYSDTYKRLTECHTDICLPPVAASTIEPTLIDNLTMQFKATGKTQAPPFSKTWLSELKDKYKSKSFMANHKRTVSALGDPIEVPPTHRLRHAIWPITATEALPTHPTATIITDVPMAILPLPAPIIAASRPPYELATAANIMARLQEFRQLAPLSVRRANYRAAIAKKAAMRFTYV